MTLHLYMSSTLWSSHDPTRLLGCHRRSGKIKHLRDPQDQSCKAYSVFQEDMIIPPDLSQTKTASQLSKSRCLSWGFREGLSETNTAKNLTQSLYIFFLKYRRMWTSFSFIQYETLYWKNSSLVVHPHSTKKWRDEKLNWECSTLEGDLDQSLTPAVWIHLLLTTWWISSLDCSDTWNILDMRFFYFSGDV